MIRNLPEKLKGLRNQYGYSQKQIAERAGVSPSIISGYETGERTPSAEVLMTLSAIYRCSVDYLLGTQPEKNTLVLNTEGLTDKQIQAILFLADSMKPR